MIKEISLTFDDGSSLSNETIEVPNYEKAIGIMFEAGYNTTNCSFEAYDTKGNEFSVNDSAQNEVEITVSQTVDGYYALDPTVFAGIAKFKVRRGTQASPFTTGAENTVIKLVTRVY